MPNQSILSETQYAKLVREVRALIEEGRENAELASRQALVQTYWKIGKRISEEGLIENAGYDQAVLVDLSEELSIDASTLLRCIHFFQTYNTATSSRNLTWSHYKRLLPLDDDSERQWYENLATDENLNVAQLSKAIKEDRYSASWKGSGARQNKLSHPSEATYVYKAVVDRVIDGDTLLLRIDLGFQVWKEQRIRLAEIDAPAMDEPKGKEAYRFVLNQLAKSEFVMVKTNKIDVYGRYVGHIFYSLKNLSKEAILEKGRYLNQELVNKGLARIL